MSLGSALQIAQNSLLNVTRQTSIVSRNVTDAGNENYTRREGVLESNNLGSRVVVVRNGANTQLHQAGLQAVADTEAQRLISNQLEQIHIALNGVDGSKSPTTKLTQLHDSLQNFSSDPSNSLLASAAIQDASDLVQVLNSATNAAQSFQSSMDNQISREVSQLNNLLDEFHQANSNVVDGTLGGREVNDALDERDRLLQEISKIVPVNVLNRSGNDMVLVTQGGATLFETMPRNVTFDPQGSYTAAAMGNPIRIDGVPIVAGEGADTSASGKLAALMQVRDNTVPDMVAQLDEIARGLVEAFAETDTSGGGGSNLAGLFTYSGGPAVLPTGIHVPGLAADIRLNAAFDPAQGGNPSLLRDGGANGANYVQNQSGGASYSTHLISLTQSLDATMDFDGSIEIGGSRSLLSFASQSIGWFDGLRSEASQASLAKEALAERLSEKLSNETGVNIDEEMTQLLQLERSYEASARLISTVDEMLNTLLNIVR